VRYGNVVGSRGSVVPLFRKLAAAGELPITDERMTRFWITLQQGVQFVIDNFDRMFGGEIFIPKIPSMKMLDLAKAVAPECRIKVVGIRPGEKLHEELISVHCARNTVDMGDFYVLQPDMEWFVQRNWNGRQVPDDFSYTSDNNPLWLTVEQLREIIMDV
jgi:UDP-N-acetylglucosamine 4,6-dehydratase